MAHSEYQSLACRARKLTSWRVQMAAVDEVGDVRPSTSASKWRSHTSGICGWLGAGAKSTSECGGAVKYLRTEARNVLRT